MNTIHQFKTEAIEGGIFDLGDFKGKKMLIVNVASECGFKPNPDSYRETAAGAARDVWK